MKKINVGVCFSLWGGTKGKKHPVLGIAWGQAAGFWSVALQGWGVLLETGTNLTENQSPALQRRNHGEFLIQNASSRAPCTAQQLTLGGCFWTTLPANVRKTDPKGAFSGKYLEIHKLHSYLEPQGCILPANVEQITFITWFCADSDLGAKGGNIWQVGSQG